MSRYLTWVFLLVAACGLFSCQHAPRPGYTEQPHVVKKRQELANRLLELLPPAQRSKAAVQEATWLADTAYKASAAIARYNDPILAGWFNNRTVNTRHHWRHRGLCWHYQHDLYRELRRRPLQYFRLGCCVRDAASGSEHHVVYITSRHEKWPKAVLLEVWRYAGRTHIIEDWQGDEWLDTPAMARALNRIYPEGHRLPLEHWAMIRRSTRYNDYVFSHTPEAKGTPQWLHMQEQMKQGMRRRNGKPIDY
jgi:hypothetical protein